MIDAVLYTHIVNNLTYTGTLVFGSAEQVSPSYIIMRKVADEERAETTCQRQGDSGRALFQFSSYNGYLDASSPSETVTYLEAFKTQIANIIGVIGTTTQYRIWQNITNSVRILGDGVNESNFFGAFFEVTLWWEKV